MSTHIGPIRIIDGEPTPYSATVQRQREDEKWETIEAVSVLSDIDDWMRANRPDCKVARIEGGYFFYEHTGGNP